jgi:hypothetical protein
VTAVLGGSAVIHASVGNLAPATMSITVVSTGSIQIPFGSIVVAQGQSVQLPVSLSAPAPADGLLVTLTSSDPSIVAVTPFVLINGGATVPSAQVQANGINLGTAIITMTAPGFGSSYERIVVEASAPQQEE